jgi:NAD(P)-dependent dehydrogenase (short-subunit alcohol dehydrogenase family)
MMQTLERFNLKGKIAIVTGGAGLYGKPISLALAEAGAHVIIASRNEQNCKEAAAELQAAGYLAAGMALDLSNETSIKGFTQDIINRFGRIDILINNAVSREGFKTLGNITKLEWEGAQTINSTGLMLITQAVIGEMCIQKQGSIINIGSIQGTVGPNFPVYGDTGMTSPVNYTYDKWAMVGFTKWLANYYGKFNIRVNCISPGGYGPGVTASVGDNEFVANYKRLTPLGRFAFDDDIKGPIVFLASEAASYITGHNLLVDGGWTSW